MCIHYGSVGSVHSAELSDNPSSSWLARSLADTSRGVSRPFDRDGVFRMMIQRIDERNFLILQTKNEALRRKTLMAGSRHFGSLGASIDYGVIKAGYGIEIAQCMIE